jgi:hypothetical protein
LKEKLIPSTTRKIKEFVETKPALQKILRGFLHIKKETRIRQTDSRKNKPFLSRYTSKQGIGKINGNKNDWKQQALLNTGTEGKWPQCPNQKTQNSKLD